VNYGHSFVITLVVVVVVVVTLVVVVVVVVFGKLSVYLNFQNCRNDSV
jgi:hypothetical protein